MCNGYRQENSNNADYSEISIREKSISINESGNEEKVMKLSNTLLECLENNRYFTHNEKKRVKQCSPKHLFHLATDILSVLMDELHLNDPIILDAIESSKGISLECMEQARRAVTVCASAIVPP